MDALLDHQDLWGLVLVKDCLEAPGGFVILHALRLALAQGHHVVLLAVASGAGHYQQLARKAGISLQPALASGQLVLLDLLHSLASHQPAGTSTSGLGLEGVFAQVAAAAAAGSAAGRPTSVLVDDLSLLAAAVGGGPRELAAFLHHCCHLGLAALQTPYCFVALAHWDVEEDEPWLSRLEHDAQTVIDIEPLASGQSDEVTGKLLLTRRRAAGALLTDGASSTGGAWQARELGSWPFYYKLAPDGSAEVFAESG